MWGLIKIQIVRGVRCALSIQFPLIIEYVLIEFSNLITLKKWPFNGKIESNPIVHIWLICGNIFQVFVLFCLNFLN